jgi:hypothetical protein
LDRFIEKSRNRNHDLEDEVDYEVVKRQIESRYNDLEVGKLPIPPFSGYNNISFSAIDIFYFITGSLQGAMGAVPSNTYSYQCSKNATLLNTNLQTMRNDFN